MKHSVQQRGFTLVEMLVSLGLFAVVVLICTAALLALVGVNKKAQAIQAVMNDLNVTIDGMVRNIRQGSVYDCGSTSITPNDCSSGISGDGALISFAPYGTDPTVQSTRWVYQFVAPASSTNGYIQRSKQGGLAGSYTPITSPDVSLTSVTFYVVGTDNSAADNNQPRVIIVLKGSAGTTGDKKISTKFQVEAAATQRQLDL